MEQDSISPDVIIQPNEYLVRTKEFFIKAPEWKQNKGYIYAAIKGMIAACRIIPELAFM